MTINFVKRFAEEWLNKMTASEDGEDVIAKSLKDNARMAVEMFVVSLETADQIAKNEKMINKLKSKKGR